MMMMITEYVERLTVVYVGWVAYLRFTASRQLVTRWCASVRANGRSTLKHSPKSPPKPKISSANCWRETRSAFNLLTGWLQPFAEPIRWAKPKTELQSPYLDQSLTKLRSKYVLTFRLLSLGLFTEWKLRTQTEVSAQRMAKSKAKSSTVGWCLWLWCFFVSHLYMILLQGVWWSTGVLLCFSSLAIYFLAFYFLFPVVTCFFVSSRVQKTQL